MCARSKSARGVADERTAVSAMRWLQEVFASLPAPTAEGAAAGQDALALLLPPLMLPMLDALGSVPYVELDLLLKAGTLQRLTHDKGRIT